MATQADMAAQTENQMDVAVEVVQGLERRMTVTVPDHDIESNINKKLRSIAKTAHMQGFRPGRVPFGMVKKQYLEQVRDDVMTDVIAATCEQALLRENIRPVDRPALQSRDLRDGSVLQYVVTFEVFPEVEVQGLDRLRVEKPVVSIGGEDVDRMLDRLRRQRTEWHEVERAGRSGDRLVVTFDGRIDGEPFEGSQAEGLPVVLGASLMPAGFEENLVGLKAGDDKVFEVTFPQDYRGQAVAGRTARFSVHVDSVSEPELPEVDDEFARSYGVDEGGVDQLRQAVEENMRRELDQKVRSLMKEQIMDGLLESNPIEVPHVLVEREIDRLHEVVTKGVPQPGSSAGTDLPRAPFEERARRRIRLGLLVGRLVQVNRIALDRDRFDERVRGIASTYEESEMVEHAYREREDLRRDLEAVVMEEQLVDVLLEQIEVAEVAKDFFDVIEPPAA